MQPRVTHLWAFFGELSERAISQEIRGLVEAGVDVDVLSFRRSRDAVDSPEDARLRPRVRFLSAVKSAPLALANPWTLRMGHGLSPARGPLACLTWLRSGCRRAALARALERDPPDVLHAQHAHVGWWALPVVGRLGLPMIVSARGRDLTMLRELARGRENAFEAASVRFLARSEEMARELVECGAPAERVFVHPSGVSVDAIRFRERTAPEQGDRVIVLSVGRLVPKKGMANAIAALAAPPLAGKLVRLRIIGDGPEMPRLRKMAGRLGVEDRVEFLGARAHEATLSEMSRAHIFLLASRAAPDGDREGIPNVLKEAMASGLPVVSTRHAGIPELVRQGESGLLADEDCVHGLACALDEMAQHPERWPAMGRAGRKKVEEEHDIKRLTPKLIEHYRAVKEVAAR